MKHRGPWLPSHAAAEYLGMSRTTFQRHVSRSPVLVDARANRGRGRCRAHYVYPVSALDASMQTAEVRNA